MNVDGDLLEGVEDVIGCLVCDDNEGYVLVRGEEVDEGLEEADVGDSWEADGSPVLTLLETDVGLQ